MVCTSISTSFISFVSFMLFVPSICFSLYTGGQLLWVAKVEIGFRRLTKRTNQNAVEPLCEEPHCSILNCLYHKRTDVKLGLTEQ